jgi:hypothetical protein
VKLAAHDWPAWSRRVVWGRPGNERRELSERGVVSDMRSVGSEPL